MGTNVSKGKTRDQQADGEMGLTPIAQGKKDVMAYTKTLLEKEKGSRDEKELEDVLIKSCFLGLDDVVSLLIEHDVSVNAMMEGGVATPLIAACAAQKETIVSLLLGVKGIDLELTNADGDTALHLAAFKGVGSVIVGMLIKKGAKVDAKNKVGKTALMMSVEEKHGMTIEALLDHVTNIDEKDNNGNTALIYAMRVPFKPLHTALLQKGAKVSVANKKGKTVLMHACTCANEIGVEVCLENGADVNAKNAKGKTALIYACEYRQSNIVTSLLRVKGVDVNACDEDQKTVLMYACHDGNLEIVQKLIVDGKVDINAKDRNDKTALMYCCEQGFLSRVQMLFMKGGVDLTACDKDGKTALMYACQKGAANTVDLLIQNGADINAKDWDNKTVLAYAMEAPGLNNIFQRQNSIVTVLRLRGAKTDDSFGYTPKSSTAVSDTLARLKLNMGEMNPAHIITNAISFN